MPHCHLPSPYYQDDHVTLYTGDALEVLSAMPDASVHCVVTSPPYWGLRDYYANTSTEVTPAGADTPKACDANQSANVRRAVRDDGNRRWVGGDPDCPHRAALVRNAGGGSRLPATRREETALRCRRCGARRHDRQQGLEPTPQDYVDRLRAVFAELRRVLVDTGTVWLNLGDCYSADPPGRTHDAMRISTLSGKTAAAPLRESVRAAGVPRTHTVARKNLIGMPWRVAFALQRDGWILRNAIVWHKPNAMPESVRDRLSTRYEMLFLLTRQQKYYFDLDPIREPLARPEALTEGIVIGGSHKGRHAGVDATARRRGSSVYGKYTATSPFSQKSPGAAMRPTGTRHSAGHTRGKNPGDVWSISTRPLREPNFAAFPIDIPLRCIAAGCPPDGVVLDPFSGAATTGLAARQLGRTYLGVDLRAEFHDIGLRRLGLLADRPGRAA